ncbi:Transposon Tf2-12 polyprotein [Metarhizium brunneum]|uniref:RNA-directed DNA polymerase n=1 Tax=Metarhizium brunneum TaxID=500148 RepID=A0A7D5YWM7_9HYPO|nr:Transposon Tf2-12 polyprotein [Metarhizium brunneum]
MAPRETTTASGSNETREGPTTISAHDMLAEIIRLRERVQQMEEERQEQATTAATIKKDLGEILRPRAPGPYDGSPGALQGFLTQLRAYHRQFPTKMEESSAKVLHAGGCMTGVALAWFEPIMRDYLNKEKDDREEETNTIFESYDEFEKAIKKAFGTVDEARAAEYYIDGLKQKGSASDYAARFRQLASQLDWEDEPLMSAFYKGLKEEVKDELYRENRPDNLSDYIAMAVRIDDRQKRDEPIAYGHTLNPGRMELDATKKDDKKEKKCYNCGKPGHFANKCKKPRKEWKPVPEGGKKQLNSTNQQKIEVTESEVEHKNLNWTFCYDDNCYVHMSSKQERGWFPKEPRKPKKKIMNFIGNGLQVAKQLVQEDLDEQSMEKRTLAMTGRKELHEPKSPEYLDEDSHQEILDWVRQQAEARKNRREQQYREEQDAQILTTFDEPEDRVREMSVDDDNAILDTPEASEDERSEEETPARLTATQEQAVQRYFPAPTGKHFAIPILAVDTTTAMENQTLWFPEGEKEDDPRLSPRHAEHTRLAWASCAFAMCQAHFQTKARLDAFPIRMKGYPIKAPYFRWELLEWRVKIINNDQTMILEPDSNTPIKCRAHTDPTDNGRSDKMVLDAEVMGHRVRILVDSGAMGNYISPRVVNRYQLPWKHKEAPYELTDIEGKLFAYNDGIINQETDHLEVQIQSHSEVIQLDVMDVSEHDLVLGYPWLWESNPLINWRTGQLKWNETSGQQNQQNSEERTKFRHNLAHEQSSEEKEPSSKLSKDQRQQTSGRKAVKTIGSTVTTSTALQTGIRTTISNKKTKAKIRKVIATLRKDLANTNKKLEGEKRNENDKDDKSPITKEERLKNIPKEYRKYEKLFAEELETGLPEHSQWDHQIELIDGKSTTFHKIYNLNARELETLREYIDEMLAKGYIRASTSEAGYPVMFVPKKNGKLRLVVDYRRLNAITMKDRTPLPLISELRDRLHGMNWFTALDLKGAYNLIRIKKGHEWKTAFRTKFGLFEYLVMPFGLTNAPATFQRMINSVLRKYLDNFVVVYLDDILIFSKTLEDHKRHVHKEVDFLGHTIRPNEIRMEKTKIEAVRNWPTPKNVKDIQSFRGFANYYRRFIKSYGEIAAPLDELTKKDKQWNWNDEAQCAFDKIKELITSEPVLRTFDPEKETELETDSSDFALGAQVGQRDDDGKLHPIAFYSKKLHGAELNYPIYDKEFLAIINAFKEFRHYLMGSKHKVKVYTDHKNISHFATTQQLNGRQIRWAEYLSEFDYEIIHRKGSENGRADALSRRSDYDTGVPTATGPLLEINKNGNFQQKQLNAILKVQKEDPVYGKIHQWATDNIQHIGDVPTGCTCHPGGVPMYGEKIWIPPELQEECIKEMHEHPVYGHQGIRKTLDKIRRQYDFSGIKKMVEKVVNECIQCGKSKASRHKPYGELQPLPVPTRPWESIAFDHITKLPMSKEPMTNVEYDSIFVVTDRLTKYGYFLPYREASNAEELAYVFLRTIASNHGLPEEIISDRGSTFTSKFWQALMAQLGTNHKLSTAYHPQTDGQTERLNQTLEQYLRCYINHQQDDWVKWLPTAQLAYNSSISESTKQTPAYANYGFNPEVFRTQREGPQAERAMLQADELKRLHEEMRHELEFVRNRMAQYHNRKRSKGPIFGEGDMVYLLRRNIKTTRPSDKLDYKKLGPFAIKKRISTNNYELSLPKTMRNHPIVHISLLEKAPNNAPAEEDIEVMNETEYEVERILDMRTRNKTRQYLIKWKSYGDEENTWEPTEHLKNCQHLLRQYHQQHSTRHPQTQRSNPTRQ